MRPFLFLFALLFSLNAFPQRIQDFTVFDGGNGSVGVRFVITPGPVCSGFEVMHSTDSMTYKSVYLYDQDCGLVSEPQALTWSHTNPELNQTNYYRIQLLSPYETSETRRVYVTEPGRARLIAFPNPVYQNIDMLNLKAVNAGNVKLVGYMYNRLGNTVRPLELISHADLAALSVNDLGDGLYVIWLTDGSEVYSTKFVVKR